MNKIIKLTLLIFTFCFLNSKICAKTISQLESELEASKQELRQNQEQTKLTQSQMNEINSNIKVIQNSISDNINKIKNLNIEIEQLNEEIKTKEAEIKKLANYAQVSNGESAYLEYIFGADDYTDFIYRTAVAEQLSKYNDELINDFKDKIQENKKKTTELDNQKIALANKQSELEQEYKKLGNNLSSLVDIKVDIEDAIKMEEALIKEYKNLGCRSNEEFSACLNRLNSLPPDTQFWRPLNSGHITSRFGYRILNNSGDNHEGLDIGTPTGTPVYAIANGVVVATYAVGGTGNAVYVRHNVNGRRYTSIYMHLSRYNVKLNDVVTKDTIVGYSGCTGQCFGPHLHLGLVTGYAGVRGDSAADFTFWSSSFFANLTDPATVVNFPSGYGSFTDRTTYYR